MTAPLPRRLAALLLAMLAALHVAAPAGADPAPVPASLRANVLTCGATAADFETTSTTATPLPFCTIEAPSAGLIVVLGAAGTAYVDGPYEAELDAYVQWAGHSAVPVAQRRVDVGAAGEAPAASLVGSLIVGKGSVDIWIAASRSGALPGTARITGARLSVLFVPGVGGMIGCLDARASTADAGATPVAAAACTTTVSAPARAIVLGGGQGSTPGSDPYVGRASLRVDGAELPGSARSWNGYPNDGDGTDIPFATSAVVPVAPGDHDFALTYAVTSDAAPSAVLGSALVVLLVPDAGSRLRLCSSADDAEGALGADESLGDGCVVSASGPGTLLTAGGVGLRAATDDPSHAEASLLGTAEVPDGVVRRLTLPLLRNGPWQDAAIRDVAAAGLPLVGLRVRNVDAETAFGSGSVLGLFVPAADTTAPDTAIADGPASGASRAATFALESADPDTARFTCSLDGAAWADCAASATFADLADGDHELRASAIDDVGNIDQTPATWPAWTVDATPPAITVDGPADGQVVVSGTPLTASYRCDDAHPATCLGSVPDGAPIDTTTVDGPRAFTVAATDAFGNRSRKTVHFRIAHPVTVDAGDATVAWGAPLPAIAPSARGLLEGDTLASLGAGLACAPVVPSARPAPGTYPTRCAGGDAPRYLIGYHDGTLTVTPPAPARAARVAGRRLVVVTRRTRTLPVTCALDAPGLASCTATLVARIGGRATTLATVTRSAEPSPTGRIALALPVDARLRRLARRPAGLRATIVLRAAQVGHAGPVPGRAAVQLAPGAVLTLPTDRLFRGRTARLSAAGTASLAALADLLDGARRLTCIGHTDARGPAARNAALGRARARAACTALRRGTATVVVGSRGETRPRASNRTAAGRALNRRVTVGVRY